MLTVETRSEWFNPFAFVAARQQMLTLSAVAVAQTNKVSTSLFVSSVPKDESRRDIEVKGRVL